MLALQMRVGMSYVSGARRTLASGGRFSSGGGMISCSFHESRAGAEEFGGRLPGLGKPGHWFPFQEVWRVANPHSWLPWYSFGAGSARDSVRRVEETSSGRSGSRRLRSPSAPSPPTSFSAGDPSARRTLGGRVGEDAERTLAGFFEHVLYLHTRRPLP